jgi:heme/copper-type cytochrome/quinol oxidase subunit 4
MYQVKCPDTTRLCFKDVDGKYGMDTVIKNISSLQKKINTNRCSDKFRTYLDKNNKTQTITKCSKNPKEKTGTSDPSCNNCDYMFENLMTGETTCNNLYDTLVEIGKEKDGAEQLKNQIKYNLTQVALTNLRTKPGKISSMYDWWKEYIWGVNKIQNYIYMVSAIVAFILCIYLTQQSFKLYNLNPVSIGFIIIIAIVLTSVSLYYFFKEADSDLSSGGDCLDANRQSDVKKSSIYFMLSIIFTLLLLFVVPFKALIDKGTITGKYVNPIFKFLSFVIFGFVISINAFYVFTAPQLLILLIILQKILMSGLANDFILNGFKGLISLAVLVLSLIFFTMNMVDNEDSEIDKCTGQEKTKSGLDFSYYYLLPNLLGVLTIIYIWRKDWFGKTKDNAWGLFLEPFVDLVHKT